MIPRILERLDRARQEFGWKELCHRLVPCATVMRWRSRVRAGEPVVGRAGPRKQDPGLMPGLQERIRQLDHGPRRTAGTGAMYVQCSAFISRRRFRELVAQERKNQTADMTRIEWLRPATVWSLDTTEYGSQKWKITPVRDLASKYQMPIPLVARQEQGEAIAAYLATLFRREGAPMFLKRDLGSPLNGYTVDSVLEQWGVLPLNSPPGYPRYNGSMERSMQDLKGELDCRRAVAQIPEVTLAMEVELATHALNHRRRPCLKGLTPCQVYHDPQRRVRLYQRDRKRIYDEIFGRFWELAQDLPDQDRPTRTATWRLVVEDWLRCQGWITVRRNQQKPVSTISNGFCSHN
jgi:hypothetical protein